MNWYKQARRRLRAAKRSAYDEGVDAFLERKPRVSPYPIGSAKSKQWFEGWDDSKKVSVEHDDGRGRAKKENPHDD